MSDSFREVSQVSWFGRLRNSVVGVLIGLLLIIAMIVLLFWNEGRAVMTAKSLAEGAGLVVSVEDTPVEPSNDGKLVHVSGVTTASMIPTDTDFGIAAAGLRLERSVEMFQWRESSSSETTTKLGGGQETVTTYSYSKAWSDRPIQSSDFKQPTGHQNPPMEIRGRDFAVPEASLGAFRLGSEIIARIGGGSRFDLGPSNLTAVENAYAGRQRISISDGRIYLGSDPTSPRIGDYRISYTLVPLGPLSLVGRQSGDTLQPYQTQAGDALLLVQPGTHTAAAMFDKAVSDNTVLTWILRGVGLVLLFVGFLLFASPLGVMADVIPFLGSIVRLGTGVLAFAAALLAGTITIGIAWFWYRPLLSITLVAITLAVAAFLSWLGRRKAVPAAAAPASRPQFGR